ncbi:hypothetical protein [Streptomyces sp. NPDC015131]|uniref:hypothetical protein n=1 Tax=Streptomyces sp. NPDC015131 TaxID=3364941 RepID=UPI0036F4FE19
MPDDQEIQTLNLGGMPEEGRGRTEDDEEALLAEMFGEPDEDGVYGKPAWLEVTDDES